MPVRTARSTYSPSTEAGAADLLGRRFPRCPAGARAVHDALVAASLGAARGPVSRRASITGDGTPIVYSHELTGAEGLRLMVEPGPLDLGVREQVETTLATLADLLAQLGWTDARAEVEAIVAAAVPPRPADIEGWWGGMWLGAALGADRLELRLYVNLRHGGTVARWQRAADALSPFAGPELQGAFRALIDRVAPHGRPVGLGVVVAGGRVRGVRLYVALAAPHAVSLHAVTGRADGQEEIALLCWALPPRPNAVTLGCDFRRGPDGRFAPRVARVKLDASAQHLDRAASDALPDRLAPLARACGGDAASLTAFLEDVGAAFGAGAGAEYVSLGFRGSRRELTLYARPLGHARS